MIYDFNNLVRRIFFLPELAFSYSRAIAGLGEYFRPKRFGTICSLMFAAVILPFGERERERAVWEKEGSIDVLSRAIYVRGGSSSEMRGNKYRFNPNHLCQPFLLICRCVDCCCQRTCNCRTHNCLRPYPRGGAHKDFAHHPAESPPSVTPEEFQEPRACTVLPPDGEDPKEPDGAAWW